MRICAIYMFHEFWDKCVLTEDILIPEEFMYFLKNMEDWHALHEQLFARMYYKRWA